MAAVAKVGTPSFSSLLIAQKDKITGLLAGEDIAAADACYIASDGTAMLSDGTAADAAAKVRGFAAQAALEGEAVTLLMDANWAYGAGLTPGIDVFLSAATPGALSDVATTGGTAPIGFVIDATRIRLYASRY